MTELPKKKRISTASAKDKGRRLQKWTCEKISKLTGFDWGKDCPIESRPMGQSGVDVRLESHVLKAFPFSIECKWQESWAIPAWIKQAQTNEKSGTNWLLVCKRSNEKPIVIIDAVLFFEIMEKTK